MINKINIISSCLQLISENKFYLAKLAINKEISNRKYRNELLELLLHINVTEEDWISAEKTAILIIEASLGEPKIYNNYGYILYKLGKFEESALNYKKAIELNFNYTEAYNNLGVALVELNLKDEAISIYERAIKINGNSIDILINLASLLSELKRYKDAEPYYEKAIRIDNNNPFLMNNYANLQKDIGDYNKARKYYDKAIELEPIYLDALFNRADLNRATMHFNAALKDIELLLKFDKNPLNYCIKAYICRDLCLSHEAFIAFNDALSLDKNCAEAYWSKPFTGLIPVYLEQNIEKIINEIEHYLNELKIGLTSNKYLLNIESGVGATLPFYLAYQNGQNKKIFELYGDICIEVMKDWQHTNKINNVEIKENKKIKLGIIGAHFKSHSVWHAITKGVLSMLNKSIFSIFIFDLGKNSDSETNIAKSNADKYFNDQGELKEWYKCIVESSCDILIYPEIGMHQLTYQLACLRISDIQLCFWGHPETTGLKTIDYYVSAELFETTDSSNNYVEQLIVLPNLGTYLFKDFNFNEFEIISNIDNLKIPVILCAGMLYKYQPMYDWIFTELVRKIGKVKILFFSQNNEWKELFFKRLKLQFDKEGLNIHNYVSILSFQEKNMFSSLMQKSTLLLDSIGFSGFNTALMAIENNLPIVSLKNNCLKGNLANAILRRIGLNELIAKDFDEFFNVTLKLAEDKNYKNYIQTKIRDNKIKLYADCEVIYELENFLITEHKKFKSLLKT
jgi:protein O-GlcNAc transferase